MTPSWDARFLALAKHVSEWSKDPSTKVGCVVTDGKRVVSMGYNGFAAGCDDSVDLYADRETKYRRVIHADMNAVLFAGRSLVGCTAYTWPLAPCPRCTAVFVQVGISRVVAPVTPPDIAERWGVELVETRRMFTEAGVTLVEVRSDG